MKKYFACILTSLIVLSLFGCNQGTGNENPSTEPPGSQIVINSADEVCEKLGPISYTCDLSKFPTADVRRWYGKIIFVDDLKLLVEPVGEREQQEFGKVVWLLCDQAFAYSVGQVVDYYFCDVIAPDVVGEPLSIIATTVCIP